MRKKPKHRSCSQEVLDTAFAQAKREGMTEYACECDSAGTRTLRHIQPAVEVENPCRLCKGFGWTWDVDGAIPRFDAMDLLGRHEMKLGWGIQG